MPNAFSDPEVRQRAIDKSRETRARNADLRRQEHMAFEKLQAAPRHAPPPVIPERQEVEAALQVASAAMPELDNLFEVPEARRADMLDIKLAAAKSNRAGLQQDAFVRRRSIDSNVTERKEMYGNEEKPRQLKGLFVDSDEPGRIVVYDEQWVARNIPEQNFKAVLKTGKLTYTCVGCGGEHVKVVVDGHGEEHEVIDYAVDACPAKQKVMRIRCPECKKRGINMVIADVPPNTAEVDFLDDEEGFVQFEAATDSTPKQRLLNQLHIHLAWRHPDEALAYGVKVAEIRSANMIGANISAETVRG